MSAATRPSGGGGVWGGRQPPPPQDKCSEYVLCAPLFATALCGVTTTVFLAPRDRHSRCVASAHFCFFAHLGRHNKCAFSRQCVSWFPSFAKAVAKFQHMSPWHGAHQEVNRPSRLRGRRGTALLKYREMMAHQQVNGPSGGGEVWGGEGGSQRQALRRCEH